MSIFGIPSLLFWEDRTRIIVILALAMSTMPSQAQPAGVINAKVVDQSGNPVTGAVVQMESADGRILAAAIPECLTDETGACSRKDLPFGKYRVTAMKKADGYTDVTFSLYGHNTKPLTAEITPDAPAASLSVKLGPKAASITINVVDDATGARVGNPTVILRLASAPNVFISSGLHSDSRILIPPDEDILVEVSAEGRQPWRMEMQPGAAHPNALHLHSEETREFEVRLPPK